MPAFGFQHRADTTIAIASVFCCQSDDALGQHCFVIADLVLPALCGTRLADDLTSSALRDAGLALNVIHTLPTAGRA